MTFMDEIEDFDASSDVVGYVVTRVPESGGKKYRLMPVPTPGLEPNTDAVTTRLGTVTAEIDPIYGTVDLSEEFGVGSFLIALPNTLPNDHESLRVLLPRPELEQPFTLRLSSITGLFPVTDAAYEIVFSYADSSGIFSPDSNIPIFEAFGSSLDGLTEVILRFVPSRNVSGGEEWIVERLVSGGGGGSGTTSESLLAAPGDDSVTEVGRVGSGLDASVVVAQPGAGRSLVLLPPAAEVPGANITVVRLEGAQAPSVAEQSVPATAGTYWMSPLATAIFAELAGTVLDLTTDTIGSPWTIVWSVDGTLHESDPVDDTFDFTGTEEEAVLESQRFFNALLSVIIQEPPFVDPPSEENLGTITSLTKGSLSEVLIHPSTSLLPIPSGTLDLSDIEGAATPGVAGTVRGISPNFGGAEGFEAALPGWNYEDIEGTSASADAWEEHSEIRLVAVPGSITGAGARWVVRGWPVSPSSLRVDHEAESSDGPIVSVGDLARALLDTASLSDGSYTLKVTKGGGSTVLSWVED